MQANAYDIIMSLFPECEICTDNEGQIIIYTGDYPEED